MAYLEFIYKIYIKLKSGKKNLVLLEIFHLHIPAQTSTEKTNCKSHVINLGPDKNWVTSRTQCLMFLFCTLLLTFAFPLLSCFRSC